MTTTHHLCYRIERTNGSGPYYGEVDEWEWIGINNNPHTGHRHPGPKREYNCNPNNTISAFRSLPQLNRWFNNAEIDQLFILDFAIVCKYIPTNAILHGHLVGTNKQAIITAEIWHDAPTIERIIVW